MPTVTWARLDPQRRAAVAEAAEAEFGAHGFSQGSLNAIARRGGVAKGSNFQYFAAKRDLYAYILDVASERVPTHIAARSRESGRYYFVQLAASDGRTFDYTLARDGSIRERKIR